MRFRTFLLGLSGLSIAAAAAFFSVTGLSKLFAGSALAIMIMAGTLEAGKLIAASFLYEYWDRVNKLLRTYLLTGVIVLILITSMGIYGFLTSAYQTTADELTGIERQVDLIELKKERFNKQLEDYRIERQSLNESINELTSGLSNNTIQYRDEDGNIITTTSSATRNVLNEQLDDAQEQRSIVSQRIESVSDSLTRLELEVLEVEQSSDAAAEIGPLRYLSDITGRPMNFIVNIFALLIVFVFDPLAVTLIVAYNAALRIDRNEKEKSKVDPTNYKIYVDPSKNSDDDNSTVETVDTSDITDEDVVEEIEEQERPHKEPHMIREDGKVDDVNTEEETPSEKKKK